jgi:hypothetical protein
LLVGDAKGELAVGPGLASLNALRALAKATVVRAEAAQREDVLAADRRRRAEALDQDAEQRDRQAAARDRLAAQRDRVADERDADAEARDASSWITGRWPSGGR